MNRLFWSIFLFQLVVSHSLQLGQIGTTLSNDDDDDDNDNQINPRSGPILAVLTHSLLHSRLACQDDVDKEKRKQSLISGYINFIDVNQKHTYNPPEEYNSIPMLGF